MNQKQGGQLHPILNALFLPIFVPIAVLSVPISIPISKLSQRLMRQREETFRAQMKASNRTIEWADFTQAIEDDLGTPIEERYSIKGPVRWWWTPESIREQSPHPLSDWPSMLHDDKFAPFSKWCNERYIHPETGGALLVCPPQDAERKSLAALAKALKERSNRWVDAVPPAILTQQKSAPNHSKH